MMDNDLVDDTSMDLDLNQEPSDPSVRPVAGLGSLLSELETAHGQIEERIRQLEAVTARARQRQRWRQARNPPETRNALIEPMGDTNGGGTSQNVEHGREGTVERAKNCKRDRTHLVAEALGQNNMAKRVIENEAGGYFDCNICLDTAKEPILTCCGHLFCWSCFYQLPYVYSTAKECPVCKGEVMDRNVTPIYGSGTHVSELQPESGLKVPPRPKAHRVESVRQQHIDRVFSHIPVSEALRRIRREIDAMEGHRWRLDPNSRPDRNNFPGHSQQLFSVLSESADSLLSISSALNNAERLVDVLESYIRDHIPRRSHRQVLSFNAGENFPDFSVALPRNQIQEDIAAIHNDFSRESHQRVLSIGGEDVADNNSAAPLAASFETMRVSARNLALQSLRRLPDTETSLTEPRTMRRIRLSILSDVENEVAREHRRRRLS